MVPPVPFTTSHSPNVGSMRTLLTAAFAIFLILPKHTSAPCGPQGSAAALPLLLYSKWSHATRRQSLTIRRDPLRFPAYDRIPFFIVRLEGKMLSVEENERVARVGPGTPMGELLRRYWHPIAVTTKMMEPGTRAVRLLGEDLVLYRDRSGQLGLVGNRCAHRRAGLVYGIP